MKSLILLICYLCFLNKIISESNALNSNESLCFIRKTANTCSCSYKTHKNLPILTADCARLHLKEFPKDYQLKKVEYLDLSHNLISALDSNTNNFGSHYIRSINLSFNVITHVLQDFFKNTPNLIELDLSHNNMVNFPNSNIFRGLKSLRILNIGYNKLPTLPEEIFSRLDCLEHLDLSYNYFGSLLMSFKNIFNSSIGLARNITSMKLNGLDINKLPYMYFDGAENLNHLSLANNPLVEIPKFPYSLDSLDLSETSIPILSAKYLNYHSLKVLTLNRLRKLERIEHYAFYNLQSLKELHMSDCRNLKEFSDLAFGRIDNKTDWSLKKIFLARSGLKTLNSSYLELFKKLEHVDLQNNPWICDCNILWLQELNTSLYKVGNLRCNSPAYLVNKEIMKLTDANMEGCSKVNSTFQKILISILGFLIAILVALIVYLVYLGPFYYQSRYRGIGPESPYYQGRRQETSTGVENVN